MCSAFSPDCGYDNSTIILIGDVFCPNTKRSGELCLLKKTFQSLGRSDYQRPQSASACQVRNIPFEDQKNFLFSSFGEVVYILEESPKSIQDDIGYVYCPGKFVSTEKNAILLAVMQQLRDPFMVVESVEHGGSFTKFLLCYKST